MESEPTFTIHLELLNQHSNKRRYLIVGIDGPRATMSNLFLQGFMQVEYPPEGCLRVGDTINERAACSFNRQVTVSTRMRTLV